MAKYDLKFKSTDAGTQKARTLTLSNVNPNASAQTLKSFTQKLNALTTNTYVETDLVVTTNLDTETPPIDTRQEPTFDITINLPTGSSSTNNAYTTNSDGVVSFAVEGLTGFAAGLAANANTCLLYSLNNQPAGAKGTLTVRITGTDTYKPLEKTYELNY